MYYVEEPTSTRADEPSAIDPSLHIQHRTGIPQARELPYWPWYGNLNPGQRHYYLEWLQSGRRATPCELGYLFLFIYGLERRALVDAEDQKVVFDEIMRLRELYAGSGQTVSGSFDSYTTSFLWFLLARFSSVFSLKRVQRLMESSPHLGEDHLAAALCWFACTQTPLPDWAACILADDLPQSQRSVVAKRVPEEMSNLFRKRYVAQYGDGIVLQTSEQRRLYAYRPASGGLPHMEFNGPKPLGLAKLSRDLSEVWNQCIVELKKYSSLVIKEGQDQLTAVTWEALPRELQTKVDHPLTGAFCRVVNAATDENGYTIVTASSLATAAEFPASQKYTPSQSRRLCATAGYVGFALEPDAHLTGRGYQAEDRLSVFLRNSEHEPDPVRYNAAACMFRVGIAIAAVDGKIHDGELTVLMQQIQGAFELNDAESRRLEALRVLLVSQPPDVGEISRIVKNLTSSQRRAVSKLVLALVAADGVITPEELRAVRVTYKALGFEKDQIDQALESLRGASDEPVTLQRAQTPRRGESVPLPPMAEVPTNGLKLNHAAIEAIMADTREVAQMLAVAMSFSAETEVESMEAAGSVQAVVIAGEVISPASPQSGAVGVVADPEVEQVIDETPPSRYAAFYQVLITRTEWTIREAEVAARQHGHMLSGAIESLNEWAVERFGNPLFIEDGDQLIVDKQIIQ